MATNKLLPFANGVGANVVDYATWSSLSTLLGQGFVTGVARSDYANRVFAQGALASYILGQFVVDQTAQDADLNESVFYTNFKNALLVYIKANSVTLNTTQTIGGTKTFSSSPLIPTATAGDNSTKAASTAFVKKAIDDHTDSIKPVSYAEQSLTDAEKTQARTNIGAQSSTDVLISISNNAVKYSESQTLTNTQKVQARMNIGAIDDTNVVHTNDAQTITGQKAFNKDPIGSNGFSYFPVPNSAAAHNCLFRGIDLSQKYTIEELSALVQAGDFSDIYIGDYYPMSVTIDDTTYNLRFRVADLDYFVHNGDTELTAHHIVFVPDEVIMTNQKIMNDSNVTTGGFAGSKAWTTVIPKITTGLQNAFGSAHVLKHRRYLTSTVDANAASAAGAGFVGGATDCTWADAYACFMNEVMAYGSTAFSSSGRDVSDGNKQFALFRIAKSYLSKSRYNWWLSSVAGSAHFASCALNGLAYYAFASAAASWIGVRPYFLFA